MTSTMSHCWVRTLCAWVCNKCAKYRTGAIWVAIFLPVWTRVKKIVAIQIALFSACGDTRKNRRDLNRDSNRAFLVCGNGPIELISICSDHFAHFIPNART